MQQLQNNYNPNSKFKKIIVLIFISICIIFVLNFNKIYNFAHSYVQKIPYYQKINHFLFGTNEVIEIIGNKALTKDEILTYIHKENIQNINQISKILTKHPLIKYATVKKFLPNKLGIFIKERDLIFAFYNQKAKQFFSITNTKNIINYYNKNLDLPLLFTPFNEEILMDDVFFLYKKLISYNILPHVTHVISFFNFRYNLVLNDKILVSLPEDDVEEALSILQDLILENNILEKSIKHLDLRVQNKIIIEYFDAKEQQLYIPQSSYSILSW